MNLIDRQQDVPAAIDSTPTLATRASVESSNWRLGRISLITVAVVVLAAFAGLIPRWQRAATLRSESKELATPTVSVILPQPGKATGGLSLPAEIRPFVEAPIYARANGYLKKRVADIGDHVEKGQLLAEVDAPELNQELAQARAELIQAGAALTLAKTTAARWAELLKSTSVSEQEAAEKQADFQLKTATVEGATANVRRLEELQGFCRIVAPFSGTVTTRRTDVGELISATSGKELFRLAQTGTLRIYVHVPQSAARGIIIGQTADLTIPELPGRVFEAKILRTSGAMNSDSRTLLTELEVDNQKGEILAGSYAQIQFKDMNLNAVLTLPSNTLLFRAEGTQVGILTPEGKVELRKIALGRDFGQAYEVLQGLQSSDRVILNPPDSIVKGQSLRLVDLGHSASDK